MFFDMSKSVSELTSKNLATELIQENQINF